MRTFVTGGTGMVGSRLCQRLAGEGHEVTALVRPTSDRSALAGSGVSFVEGTLPGEPEALKEALKGHEWVFHCAAMVDDWAPREEMRRVNVDGLEALLEESGRAHV